MRRKHPMVPRTGGRGPDCRQAGFLRARNVWLSCARRSAWSIRESSSRSGTGSSVGRLQSRAWPSAADCIPLRPCGTGMPCATHAQSSSIGVLMAVSARETNLPTLLNVGLKLPSDFHSGGVHRLPTSRTQAYARQFHESNKKLQVLDCLASFPHLESIRLGHSVPLCFPKRKRGSSRLLAKNGKSVWELGNSDLR